MKPLPLGVILVILSGCAKTQFYAMDDDTYRLTKNSDACAIGSPDGVKGDLWMEATRFCAGRREFPVEISASGEYGIPYLRCASAELVFRCQPRTPAAGN